MARVDHALLLPGVAVRFISMKVGFTNSSPKWPTEVHQIESWVSFDTFEVNGVSGTFKVFELPLVAPTPRAHFWGARVQEQERQQLQKERRLQRQRAREGLELRPTSTPLRRRSSRVKERINCNAGPSGVQFPQQILVYCEQVDRSTIEDSTQSEGAPRDGKPICKGATGSFPRSRSRPGPFCRLAWVCTIFWCP